MPTPVPTRAKVTTRRRAAGGSPQSTPNTSQPTPKMIIPWSRATAKRLRASPNRMVEVVVGVASMRLVTPRRRASIRPAAPASEVMNTNRTRLAGAV